MAKRKQKRKATKRNQPSKSLTLAWVVSSLVFIVGAPLLVVYDANSPEPVAKHINQKSVKPVNLWVEASKCSNNQGNGLVRKLSQTCGQGDLACELAFAYENGWRPQ